MTDELNESIESVEAEAQEAEESVLPEKFQGKTAEDIAKSYLELEKELGRKSNEVGELRRLTDQYLHQELSRKETPKEEDPHIELDDLLENPEKVLDAYFQKKMGGVEKRIDETESQRKLEKFHADNPDYQEVSNSQEFYNWVNASPYRTKQLTAAQGGDFDAASDILQAYRDNVKAAKDIAEQAEKEKREEDLAAASVESSGTGASPSKIYKRTELMAMYINDPEKYDRMKPEIDKAYAEDRVR